MLLNLIDRKIEDEDPDKKNILLARSRVELPFWLAEGLLDVQMVRIQLPKYYLPEFIKVFSADSEIANLRDKSYYYYELVKHIVATFGK
jgi:hypothetical protein